ncbi:MAG TPA: hypothetical protein VGM90_25500 [Kofleriaceae bacterium]|jgi:hypothetical protein
MDLDALGSMSSVQQAYTVKAAKMSLDATKAQGQAAVALIQSAAQTPPPVGPNGEGARINTYA